MTDPRPAPGPVEIDLTEPSSTVSRGRAHEATADGTRGAATVWLASYPKSGNTWFRAAYTAAVTGEPVDINAMLGGPVAAARATIDHALGIATSDLTADELEALRPRADEVVAAAGDQRLRKVHDALFRGAAGEHVVSVRRARAVYLVRDPRDVAVSWSHHMNCSLERAVDQLGHHEARVGSGHVALTAQARQRLGSWSDHVRSWVDQHELSVSVVRYEDLRRDPVATFAPALRFAGLEADDGEVATAVDRAGFAQLQAQEDEHGFRERMGVSAPFFRQGTDGGWRRELPRVLARRVEDDHGEVMARFGYQG